MWGPQSEAQPSLPRSLQIGREGAEDSEKPVKGVWRKDFPITSIFFSFLHLFYFVHLGRKALLTASKRGRMREVTAATGGRDGLRKPAFKDHGDAGGHLGSRRRQNHQPPGSQDGGLGDSHMLCDSGRPPGLSGKMLC